MLAAFTPQLHVTIDEPRELLSGQTEIQKLEGRADVFRSDHARQGLRQFPCCTLCTHPELKKSVSGELKKRMQGKGMFQFPLAPLRNCFANLLI